MEHLVPEIELRQVRVRENASSAIGQWPLLPRRGIPRLPNKIFMERYSFFMQRLFEYEYDVAAPVRAELQVSRLSQTFKH